MSKTITDHHGNEWTKEQLEPFIEDALETFGWPVLGEDSIEILGIVIKRALYKDGLDNIVTIIKNELSK
jgi:hypothetical protein